MVYLLDEKIIGFPDPRDGEESGLFAVGGDLSIDRLLLAYSNGIFPWYSFRDSEYIQWYCPMKRFVIFPDEVHVSHSMRQMIKKGRYAVTLNQAFDDVISNCSELRIHEDGAWLGPDIIEAYTKLHEQGFAISVEVWDKEDLDYGQKPRLVGGLYGVNIGKMFIGESMFSLVPSASKLALISLAQFMKDVGGSIIDCQLETAHLKSMGGRYISYDEYMDIMREE